MITKVVIPAFKAMYQLHKVSGKSGWKVNARTPIFCLCFYYFTQSSSVFLCLSLPYFVDHVYLCSFAVQVKRKDGNYCGFVPVFLPAG